MPSSLNNLDHNLLLFIVLLVNCLLFYIFKSCCKSFRTYSRNLTTQINKSYKARGILYLIRFKITFLLISTLMDWLLFATIPKYPPTRLCLHTISLITSFNSCRPTSYQSSTTNHYNRKLRNYSQQSAVT